MWQEKAKEENVIDEKLEEQNAKLMKDVFDMKQKEHEHDHDHD